MNNMKELKSWGIQLLNWSYTIENGKLVRTYYKDIMSLYPRITKYKYRKGWV